MKPILKFTLADMLLLLIPIAFGVAYGVPFFNQRPIEWQRFSTDKLALASSCEKPVLILFKPRFGGFNDLAVRRLNHPTIQRASHSGQLIALDYEFGYAESFPESEHDEIVWLMAQPAYHKDAFAVVAFPDGRTVPVNALDPNSVVSSLSLKEAGSFYLWLAISSLCGVVGRAVVYRKSRNNR